MKKTKRLLCLALAGALCFTGTSTGLTAVASAASSSSKVSLSSTEKKVKTAYDDFFKALDSGLYDDSSNGTQTSVLSAWESIIEYSYDDVLFIIEKLKLVEELGSGTQTAYTNDGTKVTVKSSSSEYAITFRGYRTFEYHGSTKSREIITEYKYNRKTGSIFYQQHLVNGDNRGALLVGIDVTIGSKYIYIQEIFQQESSYEEYGVEEEYAGVRIMVGDKNLGGSVAFFDANQAKKYRFDTAFKSYKEFKYPKAAEIMFSNGKVTLKTSSGEKSILEQIAGSNVDEDRVTIE